MIELYYWNTPNGYKVQLFLEEAKVPYKISPVNIGAGDQFKPDFLKIAPNNRIPAIVDTAPIDGGAALSVFESGAILVYLAEKTGQFLPSDLRGRTETLQWLFWQMGGLGPMAGQNGHFTIYAKEKIPYAIERYVNETSRLYRVLNERLSDREYVSGKNYTIADMAIYPSIVPYERHQQDLSKFSHLKRWFEAVGNRPATRATYEAGAKFNANPGPLLTDDARNILFNQK